MPKRLVDMLLEVWRRSEKSRAWEGILDWRRLLLLGLT